MLHQALCCESPEIIRLLVSRGANVNATSGGGQYLNDVTRLQSAASQGNTENVRTLIELGVDIHRDAGAHGTPLHLAAVYGREQICLLLMEAGADPLLPGRDGTSALQVARKNARHRVVDVMQSWIARQACDATMHKMALTRV